MANNKGFQSHVQKLHNACVSVAPRGPRGLVSDS